MTKNKISLIVLALVLALTLSTTAAFAEDGISPRSLSGATYGLNWQTSTQAMAAYTFYVSPTAEKLVMTVTLQEKSGSSWVTASTSSTNPRVKTAYDATALSADVYFSGLSSSKDYRAKFYFECYEYSGTKYTSTKYSSTI